MRIGILPQIIYKSRKNMSQVFHFVKIAVAVIAGVAAAVCIFVRPDLVISLGVVSLAFSQMPE